MQKTFHSPETSVRILVRPTIGRLLYQLVQSVLKIGSALAERVGQGEVGGCTALPDSAQCMVAVAAAYWKALVSDGWAICLLSCTNGHRKCSFHLCRDSISGSLVPRPVQKIGEEGLVSTVCACA